MPVAPDTLSPLLGNLLETATLTEELRVLVSTEYDTISQSDMLWLKQRSADEVDVRNILAAIEVETTNRMDNAKKRRRSAQKRNFRRWCQRDRKAWHRKALRGKELQTRMGRATEVASNSCRNGRFAELSTNEY